MKLVEIARLFRFHFQSQRPLRTATRSTILALSISLIGAVWFTARLHAEVSHGDEDSAKNYYRALSKSLHFSTPDGIFQSTLDDVAAYLGYGGITGTDLQNIPSDTLMNPAKLLAPCDNGSGCTNALQKRDVVLASLGALLSSIK